ncbi:hypothetical protein OS493_001036 [Desmophyllum pertusum]|uniref:Uncharacterized protein n=1 Tax=Desmophyllum pertusum TaxID=174260 RepID=A0A9W9ZV09_9CNID|nr:hypothetical protein OS493_001036 [Desmophyllum pertusum]
MPSTVSQHLKAVLLNEASTQTEVAEKDSTSRQTESSVDSSANLASHKLPINNSMFKLCLSATTEEKAAEAT